MELRSDNLAEKPFKPVWDPSVLWLGGRRQQALDELQQGLLAGAALLVLVGEAGAGKTTLLKALAAQAGTRFESGLVAEPGADRLAFYNAIGRSLGLEPVFRSKVDFLLQFGRYLQEERGAGGGVLLLVDDCQLLDRGRLEDLRLLSNMSRDGRRWLTLVLAGLPQFEQQLLLPRNQAIRQRIARTIRLVPYTLAQTGDFIRHRLAASGADQKLFDDQAVRAVHQLSGGLAGRIDALCQRAMAAVSARRRIDRRLIEAVAGEMGPGVVPGGGAVVLPAPGEGDQSRTARWTALWLARARIGGGWLAAGLVLAALFAVGYHFLPAAPDPPVVVEQPVAEPAPLPLVQPWAGSGSTPGSGPAPQGLGGPATGTQREPAPLVAGLPERSAEKIVVTGLELGSKGAQPTEAVEPVAVLPDEPAPEVGETEPPPAAAGERGVVRIAPEKRKMLKRLPPERRKVVLGLGPDSLRLTGAAEKALDVFVASLKAYPEAKLVVKGFVSARTNSAENIELSTERARMVRQLLLDKGIEASRIEVVGMGNREPLTPNDTREGRSLNRRVEVEVRDDGG